VTGRRKYDKSVYRALALITQFGINMLVPIFICSFAGIWLDGKLGTSYWMIVLFFVGALAGFRNIYLMAKQVYGSKDGGAHDDETKKM
jgi:F0F1-type ATP synthase assembly protein I